MVRKQKDRKINQRSFYFEDYNNYSNTQFNKSRLNISEDRIYLLFFVFFSLIFIFAIKIFTTSLQDSNFKNTQTYYDSIFKPLRNDIFDRNGVPLAKNVRVYHVAIKPNLINDKKKFILKIRLFYPGVDTAIIKKNLDKNKYIIF